MNIQELIEKIENLNKLYGEGRNYVVVDAVLELVEQLDEPEKVTIPQSVADWIEHFKKCSGTLYGSTTPYSSYGRAITDDFEDDVAEVLRWIRDNSEVYARAWLDGYEVEEEKTYIVKLKNIDQQLCFHEKEGEYYFTNSRGIFVQEEHTRKQLEEAGFGWVFDCPGIKIEEVEDE